MNGFSVEKMRALAAAMAGAASPVLKAAWDAFNEMGRTAAQPRELGKELMQKYPAGHPYHEYGKELVSEDQQRKQDVAMAGIMVPSGAAARVQANEMLREGAGLKDLWRDLGATPIPGNRLAKEIPDVGARLKIPLDQPFTGKVADAIEHDALFGAQPWIENIPMEFLPSTSRGMKHFPGAMGEKLRMWGHGTNDEALSTITHELQHAVQQKYGWPSGTDPHFEIQRAITFPEFAAEDLQKAIRGLGPNRAMEMVQDALAPRPGIPSGGISEPAQQLGDLFYKHSAGEAQSKAAELRMLLQPEELAARHPFYDYPVFPTRTIARIATPAGKINMGPSSPAFSEELLQLLRAVGQKP